MSSEDKNLLMISTDRNLFSDNSQVLIRQTKLLEEYNKVHIIVFSDNKYEYTSYQDKVFVYPTRSLFRLFYLIDALFVAKKIIKTNSISEITCQDPFETGLVGLLLKKIYKIKLELQLHTDMGSPYFYSRSFLNKIRYFMGRLTLPRADKIRVVSKRLADYVGRLTAEEKIYIKPIEVDKEKIASQPVTLDLHKKYPQFKKIVLMVSRLESEKNIPLAINAVNELKDLGVGLVVVGDGSQKSKLELLSQKLKAPVVFEGWVNDPVSYYKTADLYLNTSWYEGYGMSLVEARTAGLPVVSTGVGVASEIGAHLVPFNSQDVANCLKKVL